MRERERLYQPTKLINEGYDGYQTIFDGGKIDLIRIARAVPIHADTRFAAGLNDGYEIRDGLIYEVKDYNNFGKLVSSTLTLHQSNFDYPNTSLGQIARYGTLSHLDRITMTSGRLYSYNSYGTSTTSGCTNYTSHYVNSDEHFRGRSGYDNGQWPDDRGYWGHIYMRSSLKVINGYICNLDGSVYSGTDVFI